MTGRTLVAGVGNIFLGDDGFGVEVARRLQERPLPEGVEVADFGIRGVHLAFELLDGYDVLVLVDATSRGGRPGTVYLIEPGNTDTGADTGVGAGAGTGLVDGHGMEPDAVLGLLDTLGRGLGGLGGSVTPVRRTLVVGCEPAVVTEGIGLSPPVAAAVDGAVDVVLELLRDLRGQDLSTSDEGGESNGGSRDRPGAAGGRRVRGGIQLEGPDEVPQDAKDVT